ncbi:MAG: hypothetical protein JWL69_3299 [Phycisphaerales bacterium]|nr:hypothetical protein [Phycisphaerales bacterium]
MTLSRHTKRLIPIQLLLLLPLLCCGCDSLMGGRAQKVDLSTPKSAALDYVKAIQRGDATTAKAASTGTGEQMRWVDGLAGMVDGMRKFDEAMFAKFGKVIDQAHVDMHDSLQAVADEPVELVEKGAEVVEGEEARIELPRKGFTSHFQPTYWLRHEKQGWKVNLVKTYAPFPGQKLAQKLPGVTASFRRYEEFGDVFRAAAGDVRGGRFHSTKEAEQGLAKRMEELLRDEGG